MKWSEFRAVMLFVLVWCVIAVASSVGVDADGGDVWTDESLDWSGRPFVPVSGEIAWVSSSELTFEILEPHRWVETESLGWEVEWINPRSLDDQLDEIRGRLDDLARRAGDVDVDVDALWDVVDSNTARVVALEERSVAIEERSEAHVQAMGALALQVSALDERVGALVASMEGGGVIVPPVDPPPPDVGVDMGAFELTTRFGSRPPVSAIDEDWVRDWAFFTVNGLSLLRDNPSSWAMRGALEVNLIGALPLSAFNEHIELHTDGPLLRGDDGVLSSLRFYEDAMGGVADLRDAGVVEEKIASAIALIERWGVTRSDIDNFRMFDLGMTIGNLPSDFRDADWLRGQIDFLTGLRAAFPDLHIHINPSVLHGDSIDLINFLYDRGLINSVVEEHGFSAGDGIARGAVLVRQVESAMAVRCPIYWYTTIPNGVTLPAEVERTWWALAALVYQPGDGFGLKNANRDAFLASWPEQVAWRDAIRALGVRESVVLEDGVLRGVFGGGRVLSVDVERGVVLEGI